MTIAKFMSPLFVATGVLMALPAVAGPARLADTPAFTLSEARCPCAAVSEAEVRRLLVQSALIHDVPPELALAVAETESGFKSNVMSVNGACGIMQIMPSTARSEYGIDADELWTPQTNITLGVMYLRDLYEMYGHRWAAALSHYNGGTLGGDPVSAAPHTYTQDYVSTVLASQRRYQTDRATQKLIDRERAGQLVLAGGPDEPSLQPDSADRIESSQAGGHQTGLRATAPAVTADGAGRPVDLLVPSRVETAARSIAPASASVSVETSQLSPSERYLARHFILKHRFDETLESLEVSRQD